MCKRPVQNTNVDWLKFRKACREIIFSEVHGFTGCKNVLPILLFHEDICRYSELYCWSSSRKRCSETNSMELFPFSEANRSSGSLEVPWNVGNQKVHYCIHKSLPPIPILSLSNLFLPTPLSEDILWSVPVSSKLSPSSFPTKTMYAPLLYPAVAICHTHLDAQKVHSVMSEFVVTRRPVCTDFCRSHSFVHLKVLCPTEFDFGHQMPWVLHIHRHVTF